MQLLCTKDEKQIVQILTDSLTVLERISVYHKAFQNHIKLTKTHCNLTYFQKTELQSCWKFVQSEWNHLLGSSA